MVDRAPDRGDIVSLNFSPQAGYEQNKRRPALVLSPASYNRISNLALFVPITSKAKNWPFEFVLPNELQTAGVVLCDQVKSLDWRARNASFVEVVDASTIQEVLARVNALLDYFSPTKPR